MHDHVVSAVAADPAAGGAAPRAARRLTLDAVAGLGPVHPRLAGAECGGRDRDRQIAFILVVGILIDTFIVRALLVPAASYDLGRAIWWPSTLDRQRDDTPRWPLERDRADVPGSARSP